MNHRSRFVLTAKRPTRAQLAIVVMVLPLVAACSTDLRVTRHSDEVRRHAATDRTDAGVLQQHMAANPGDVGAAVRLVRLHAEAGRRQHALEVADRTLAASPVSAVLMGVRSGLLSDPEAREQAAAAALQHDASQMDAMATMGEVAMLRSRYQEAAAWFAKCADAQPFEVEWYARQGEAWARAGDRFRAAGCFWASICTGIGGRTDAAPWWAALASLYEGDRDWPSAAAWFRGRAGNARGLSDLPPNTCGSLLRPPEDGVAVGVLLEPGASKVTFVQNHSTASHAGVRVGDLVDSIDGQAVPAEPDLWQRWRWMDSLGRPGANMVFVVRRDGRVLELSAAGVRDADFLSGIEDRMREAAALAADRDHRAAAACYQDVIGALVVNHEATVGLARAYDACGDSGAATAVLRPWTSAFPQQFDMVQELAARLHRSGARDELRALLQGAKLRRPEDGALAAFDGLLAARDGRLDDARVAFRRAMCLGAGGAPLAALAQEFDRRETEVLIAQERQRVAEEERRAAEAAAANGAGRNRLLELFVLSRMLGGGSGGGFAGASSASTMPNHLQSWSNQQNLNGMWSHNMGR